MKNILNKFNRVDMVNTVTTLLVLTFFLAVIISGIIAGRYYWHDKHQEKMLELENKNLKLKIELRNDTLKNKLEELELIIR